MREHIPGRPWRLERSYAGVLGTMALVAALISALALAQPAEGQLSCPDRDAQCLIDKIKEANRTGQWTTIYLGKGPYTLSYASARDNAVPIPRAAAAGNALPSVTGLVSIQGLGAGLTPIELPCPARMGDGECYGNVIPMAEDARIFHVAPGGYLQLWNVSVRNGKAGQGGGLFNEGSLEVRATSILGNHAHQKGAGIYNRGWAYLQDSTINNNGGHQNGTSSGGGIYIESGLVEIAYSTINHNQANYGGGIVNAGGELLITNSTISSNHAVQGESGKPNAGGILNDGSSAVAWLKSVTITANSASLKDKDHAGGVYGRGNFYFANTIMAGNLVGADQASDRLSKSDAQFGDPLDCRGQVVTLGGNLVGHPGRPVPKADTTLEYPCDIEPWTPWPSDWPSMADDQLGYPPTPEDPRCNAGDRFYCTGPQIYAEEVFAGARQDPKYPFTFTPKLADNGGSSCTHALKTSSRAINQAWPTKTDVLVHPLYCEKYDQRWATRDSRCDIGTFESGTSAHRIGLTCSGLPK